jgi:hypothetical protein
VGKKWGVLVLVLLPGVGTVVGGARRWLRLPGLSLQPAEIAKLLNQAKDGDAAFLRALPAAATHAAPQSEAWIAAQNARSAADVARGPTLDALAALDTAIGNAIDKGQDTTALAATRTEVQAIYNGQTARLAELTR